MRYKILNTIGDSFSKEAKKILGIFGDVDYFLLTQEELKEKIPDYDLLLVGLGLNITKEVIDKGKNLKIIATATTGLDHIDIDYAKKHGIKIVSLRGENDFLDTITGTAELAFGLMIDLLRFIPHAFEDVKSYHWNRDAFRGKVLRGKTFGILGLGRLGRMMAKYAKAFEMRVIYFDPNSNNEKYEKVDFETLIRESDILSIHVHLSDETENIINAEVFDKMKDSAMLINTSRGKIVNEDDLLRFLNSQKIGGYATDVLSGELNFDKNFSNHPLVEYAKNNKNLIIVPHIGGMTNESREMTDIFIAEKIKKVIDK